MSNWNKSKLCTHISTQNAGEILGVFELKLIIHKNEFCNNTNYSNYNVLQCNIQLQDNILSNLQKYAIWAVWDDIIIVL